ncbi:MAG: MBL fold metallo-hydrolase [Lentisphaerae bacterium]|nr:MBL fold metallo-hydrolase [Lentisphaerota bacterium]
MKHIFGITNLGSGSSGNATVIHGPEGNLLLDAGFSAKELALRMAGAGIDPESIQGILISHGHSDHTKGCRVFSQRYNVPVYTTSVTGKSLYKKNQIPEKVAIFAPGGGFELCGVSIEPFTVPHDAEDTVAFVFRCMDHKIAVATDLGFINTLTRSKLTACDILMMESNHDPRLLMNSQRSLTLKRRIMGRFGHLSNSDALDELPNLLTDRTKCLIFGHLSEECNDREMLEAMTLDKLSGMSRTDILFHIAAQEYFLPTFWAI